MNTLIVYYSFTSNNEKLAFYLTKQLHCDVAKLETISKRSGFSIMLDLLFKRKPALKPLHLNLKDYHDIIFIGPVWAGKVATPLKSFIINERENIRDYSFITVCGGGNRDQKAHIIHELTSAIGKEPVKVVELWINDILSEKKKDTIKYTSGYRLEVDDFKKFETSLNDFIAEHAKEIEPVKI